MNKLTPVISVLTALIGLLFATNAYAEGSISSDYGTPSGVRSDTYRKADSIPQINEFNADNIGKAKRSADDPFDQANLQDIRVAAVREAAYGLGMRNGLAARSLLIKEFLYKNRTETDRIFNFSSLMMDCGKEEKTRFTQKLIAERPNENCVIQPPVILGAKNLLNDRDGEGEVLRYSKASFRIKKQARLITTTPIWETYLIFNAGTPGNDVHPALFPKTDIEKKTWNESLREGWEKGVEQANAIYRQNLASLYEDVSGMQRYRYLLLQNLVTKPFVARNRLGITGNVKDGISIDDVTLTITERPEFNMKSSDWMLFPSF